ncbi:hypothetical protein B0A50_00508 [Salinomyces thailandicus]|uniref:Uncharacterized protein n=1 Tax=Salinomyces thailandicus TaxID=706561 RepID=A0A4U0UFJ2_9PEZI|nr:hypothetical protein B0A50_00508 [Salinomyces thailandica]
MQDLSTLTLLALTLLTTPITAARPPYPDTNPYYHTGPPNSPNQPPDTSHHPPSPNSPLSYPQACTVYSHDYAPPGPYFLPSTSTLNFTTLTSFTHCTNDTAILYLVNTDTGARYPCSAVPTAPDNAVVQSTCAVKENALKTGNYSIVTLGENGGKGFAVQRDFGLVVGEQVTVTETKGVPGTVVTVLPAPNPILTQTEHLTQTFTRWEESAITSTKLIQRANCFVVAPPVQNQPCTTLPAGVKAPAGLLLQGPGAGLPSDGHGGDALKALERRGAVDRTTTVTTTVPNGETVTLQGLPRTKMELAWTTKEVLMTAGAGVVMAPTPQPRPQTTKHVTSYAVAYVTETMTVTWRAESTVMATGAPTACVPAARDPGGRSE